MSNLASFFHFPCLMSPPWWYWDLGLVGHDAMSWFLLIALQAKCKVWMCTWISRYRAVLVVAFTIQTVRTSWICPKGTRRTPVLDTLSCAILMFDKMYCPCMMFPYWKFLYLLLKLKALHGARWLTPRPLKPFSSASEAMIDTV